MSATLAGFNKEIQDVEDMDRFDFLKVKQNSVEKEHHIITGMHFLTENLLALADFGTSTVHLFDINSKENLSSIRLNKSPYDIRSNGDNELVTTHDKQLLVISFDETRKILKVENVEKIQSDARGIVKSGSKFFVTCVRPKPCIQLYSTGLVHMLPDIELNDECYPLSVEISEHKIFITDSETHSVKALTMRGNLIDSFPFKTEPISLAKDEDGEDGCIFVAVACDTNIHKINHRDRKLKESVCFPDAENGLLAIAYCGELYRFAASDESGKNILLHTETLKNSILKLKSPKQYAYQENLPYDLNLVKHKNKMGSERKNVCF